MNQSSKAIGWKELFRGVNFGVNLFIEMYQITAQN